MKQLVFATNNQNKLREVSSILDQDIQILSLDDINFKEEIPETSATIEENALQKANYVFKQCGYNCFADDTGLEVEALGGRPGVYSARYAGEEKDSLSNMSKLLQELEGKANRQARFKTVVALILEGKEHVFEGIIEGTITEKPLGKKGFGYDPVFIPQGYNTTFAQMSSEEKNKVSHRALAIHKMREFLKRII